MQVVQANTLADLRGWSRFVALQIRYSLIDRTAERELLPMARALDLAVTPWSVLGSGVLTGKYNKTDPVEGRAKLWGDIAERDLNIAQAVVDVAGEIDCTPSQAAISWARQQPGVIIPVIGARQLSQLEDNLGCLEVTLTVEQLARLNEVSRIELGFPHEFIESEQILDIVFGGTYDKIDNHRW